MATDQHSTSRRSVIGALAVAPIITAACVVEAAALGSVLTSDLSPRARWERALAAFRRHDAEWLAHPYGRTSPSSPDYERLEAEQGAIAGRVAEARDRVLRTAVPDHAAFAEKRELVAYDLGNDLADEYFVHLIADARRLSPAVG